MAYTSSQCFRSSALVIDPFTGSQSYPHPQHVHSRISGQCQAAQTSILRQSVYSQTASSREASLQIFKQSIVSSLVQTAESLKTVVAQTSWNVYFSQQLQLVVLRQRVPISFLEENSHKQKPLPCWLQPASSHH